MKKDRIIKARKKLLILIIILVILGLSYFLSKTSFFRCSFFACFVNNGNMASFLVAVVTLIIAIATLLATKKISFVQQWNTLMSEYRGHEFGKAVKEVASFYCKDCLSEVQNIEAEYSKRCKNETNLPAEQTLNFQRRLISQYYWQLYICAYDYFRSKKMIKKSFNKNEMNLMAIILHMNKAADKQYNSLWKNPSMPFPKSEFNIDDAIRKLYKSFDKLFKKDEREPIELPSEENPVKKNSASE